MTSFLFSTVDNDYLRFKVLELGTADKSVECSCKATLSVS